MSERTKAAQQYVVLVLLFPMCFLALRAVTSAMLSGMSWDDAICNWLDGVMNLQSPGSKKWLTDLLSILPSLWHIWFLLGAVEEIRYTRTITTLLGAEILSRWIAFAVLGQVLPLFSALFFFYLLSPFLWEPLAVLLAVALAILLYVMGWKYPTKRVRHVECIYYFEKVRG